MVRKRTNIEIVQDIYDFIKNSGKKKFFKSDLREKNIESNSAADWFRIIAFIQENFPRIKITEHESIMIIEIVDTSTTDKTKE